MYSQSSLVLLALGLLACVTAPTGQDLNEAEAAVDVPARVNKILDQYVAVEDDFFKLAPRRVVPIPGVFVEMDFVGISKKLQSLDRDLEKAQADVGRQRPARAEVRDFNSAFSDYIKRLRASIAALEGVSTKLAAKAQDPEKYSWKEYGADLDRYQKLRADYSTAGAKLNELFRRMQR
jgi:hypothetical protein